MKLGIFSGTFDPIHSGHLAAAHAAQLMQELDLVIFVPEKTPRHKKPVASYEDRIAMLRLGLENHSRLTLYEANQDAHDLQTLIDISKKYSPKKMVLLLGSDTAQNFSKWPEHEKILRLVQTCTISRDTAKAQITLNHPARSKNIRDEFRQCGTAGYLPQTVLGYIQKHKLYGTIK